MRKRWRSKSRKSSGPASCSRSGKTVPASAPPDREDRDERLQHPSPSGETAVRPNQRRKKERPRSVWIPRRLLLMFHGNVQAALKAYTEEGIAPAALDETEEESIKQNDDAILKKGCLDDANLLMDQSALRASRRNGGSGDAQEEATFGGEETSLLLKMDKKPKPSCSRDLGKIAQDEDEDGCSGKKPASLVEDEHPDKICVHATEDHKQEQGSARGHVQALLEMDAETISKKIWYFFKRLNFESPERPVYCPEYEYEPEELNELYEELALYRIRAYELTVYRKLAKLDNANLKLEYPSSKLSDNDFFKHYEKSLEWYFDPKRCKHAHFDNYQRLVLHGSFGYLDWDFYHSTLNTYEEDLAYVQYFEVVANKTKWIEDYMGDSTINWDNVKDVAYMQALEIAADFPNVSPLLISYGFNEYIRTLWSDYSHKGLDGLYFEIWKRVAKGKMSFQEALFEVHSKNMFPMRSAEIKHELENVPNRSPLKDYYDAHVAGIDKMASDDKARQLIREAVKEMDPEQKYYLDYARRKLKIAKDIELITEGRR